MSRIKLFSSLLFVISAVSLTGCSMMPHALQPKQLRRLNRGPELGRDSYNFSIPDPQPEKHQVDGMMYGDPFNN
ncbi:hypothetical protein [Rubinisphaera sp.]|uniref:hypothetical protein n=1 Tax=Rubinisphaera sp. TaxID=2024857 RepID=UPI000C0EDFFB|nr:hypothetical protein [Rubinisphaera sp.]MBV09586.1 hypothetical protein [Rubinisphaera sp.]HCS50077.1 hypothetical protein [Planctomycetaceae bacterium]|tara:strand:+ start:4282 stop:4503 length:222 start_codon:yes stop_codon:yes gene_type:complete